MRTFAARFSNARLRLSSAVVVIAVACGGQTADHNGVESGQTGGAGEAPGGSGGSMSPLGTGGTPSSGGFAANTGGSGVVRHPLGVCSNPMTSDGNWISCDEGFEHRVSGGTCTTTVARAGTGPRPDPGSASCATDADCSYLIYGHCVFTAPFGSGCEAGCVTDGDCTEGQACHCGSPVGTCIAADCRWDADCPSGTLCATYVGGLCGPIYLAGLACQASADECTGSECPICGRESDHRTCMTAIGGCEGI